ncbi:MAG TPA: hypothetical protein VMV74_03740 [Bacteroidales bacterium]|nr:hypothetical protein [Bacteroidales bacterium]
MAKFIFWAPRVLTLLIIAFLVILALDNFSTAAQSREQWVGFGISMVPALILLAAILTALKNQLAGGIIIIVLGVIMSLFMKTTDKTLPFLALSTPVLVTGILYILSHFYAKTALKK